MADMEGWTCSELKGWEVKVPSADFDQEIMKLETEEDKRELISACENMIMFREGKKVLVMGITGWVRGVVRSTGQFLNSAHVETGGSIFPLVMCEDDRKCWVTITQVNKRLLRHD